ncbi:class II fumarate hydratase [Marinicella sp. S1101]|uniref:class II fumarate hydratase n=1 Tax=Marinicella marina TaxID=2996016 RepID=UPI002260E506|nr:class II fumarate hydratase [Marinicella marina]MCX7554887.1 class II fumarate hydratase [Marinicella marina]MDJ1141289.1 class II fumarate hydratase [Marinicella marina]
MTEFRIEKDSMGELKVPVDALYGAQTQRAINNFPISGLTMPREFIKALGLIKAAAAAANQTLGHMDDAVCQAVTVAAKRVQSGEVDSHFPIDVFQTGSGTSSNMNCNEVISHLASTEDLFIHPNDHVNMGQSSNDVIPTAIAVSCVLNVTHALIPALSDFVSVCRTKADELAGVVKTGRTHLMDAMPVTFGQELNTWASIVETNTERLQDTLIRVAQLPQGGTAVGTGINADAKFGQLFAEKLTAATGVEFTSMANKFDGISAQDNIVELSGQLKVIASTMMKVANDLRWMNSGPLAGIGEIELPSLQPGSSIMPGKVNPVIPEAMAMVCAQVIGNDTTVTVAGQSGNFQLNVMLPVIAYNVLQSIHILSTASEQLAHQAIKEFKVNHEAVSENVGKNPILVTALNAVIGYDLGAKIAKQAYKEKRSVLDVTLENTDLTEQEIKEILDPIKLTTGGIEEK